MENEKYDRVYNAYGGRVRWFHEHQAVGIEFFMKEKETIFVGMSGEGMIKLGEQIAAAVERHPEIRDWISVPVN